MRLGILAVSAVAISALLVAGGLQATSGGYIARVANPTNDATTAPTFTCVQGALQDAATFAYLYTSTATATVTDYSGHGRDGTYLNSRSTAAAVTPACRRDDPGAYVLTGLTGGILGLGGTNSFAISPQLPNPPTSFSMELWFKTASASSFGQLMGFGNQNSASTGSSTYNRELYMTTSGNLVFGMSSATTISSPATYNDSAWHHVIVTVAGATQTMYVDGVSVAGNSLAATNVAAANGYWHFGFDVLLGWPSAGLLNNAFTGSVRFAALYPTALSPAAVANHLRAGSPAP